MSFAESSYKRCKDDTSVSIRWLAETARTRGYSFKENNSVATPEPAKPGARLKGKARKLAKKGCSSGATPNNKVLAPKLENRVVDSSELLGLAHAISRFKNPSIATPTKIIRAEIRAVSARKKCTAYFESVTKEDDDEKVRGNESHTYFTKLVEDVLMVLQPLFAISTTSKVTDEHASGSLLQDLRNRFAQLEAVCELESSDRKAVAEEKVFAYYCLFSNLAELRSHLNKTYREYLFGATDIMTTAAVTNTVMQLAIRAQEEALAAFPGAGDYDEVLMSIMQATTPPRAGAEVEVSISEETANWLFSPAHGILDEFCDILKPDQVPMIKQGYLGVYNPRADRSKMHGIEKHREDQFLLLELLPEFSLISKCKIDLFAADEFSKAIGQMALTKEIPIWLAFATTIFLDIHHTMRDKFERAFHDFRVIVSNAKDVMKSYMDFMYNFPRPTTWPPRNDATLRHFIWIMENTMLQDPILAGKEKCYAKAGLPISIDEERFYLYKRQPILCGIFAFRTTLMLQELGVTDMDTLICLHTPERVFIGGRPTTMVNYFKQVCLMLGHLTTNFAANRRRRTGPPAVSKNGPRGLKDTSPICEIFRLGLSEKGSMALTVHNIEELLND
ncbi:hypothetical protein ACMFMG_002335 [Clarireedia jacksonii]